MTFDLSGKKILLVRNDNIGDAILSTPVLEAIKKRYPTSFVAVLCAGYSKEAFGGNPYIDRLFVYEKAKHHGGFRSKLGAWAGHLRTMMAIRGEEFDFCVGLRSSFSRSNAALVRFSGAKTKIVRLPQNKRDMASFDAFIDEPTQGKHEVQIAFDCLNVFGIENGGEMPYVAIDDQSAIEVEDILKRVAFESKQYICFHISSRLEQNRCDIGFWLTLAARIACELGLKVAVTAAPGSDEEEAARRLFCSKNLLFFKTHTLKQLGAIVANSKAFVTTDGGAMHLGATCGVPVVALFGKTNAIQWHPYCEKYRLLQPQSKKASDITPNDVFCALSELLG